MLKGRIQGSELDPELDRPVKDVATLDPFPWRPDGRGVGIIAGKARFHESRGHRWIDDPGERDEVRDQAWPLGEDVFGQDDPVIELDLDAHAGSGGKLEAGEEMIDALGLDIAETSDCADQVG